MKNTDVNEPNSLPVCGGEDAMDAASKEKEAGDRLNHCRRRLLRSGLSASPVLLTLASRPVLAWHCKSPSAWGSEQLNPNTSLRTNPGHQSYIDEVWTIANWRDNTSRKATGTSSRPWNYLAKIYPAITEGAIVNGRFDYTKVTVGRVAQVLGFVIPVGLTPDQKVKDVLDTPSFGAYILVAQLNLTVSPPLPKSEMEKCITLAELNKMASGAYQPPGLTGVTWLQNEIKTYLYNNWFVR